MEDRLTLGERLVQAFRARLIRALCGYCTRKRYSVLLEEIRTVKPRRVLEIGTWSGRTASEMLRTAIQARGGGRGVEYYGFDLWSDATSALLRREVGLLPPSRQQVENRLHRFKKLGVAIHLYQGDTKAVLPRVAPQLPAMDLIFIDGGHSRETVSSDWHHCRQLLHSGSVVYFDDYVNPDAVQFDGYGVNAVIDELAATGYRVDVLEPADKWPRPWGLLVTRLARVKPRAERA